MMGMMEDAVIRVSFDIVGAGGAAGRDDNVSGHGGYGGDGDIVQFDLLLPLGTVLGLYVGVGAVTGATTRAEGCPGIARGGLGGDNGRSGGGGQPSVVMLGARPLGGSGGGGGGAGGGGSPAADGGPGNSTAGLRWGGYPDGADSSDGLQGAGGGGVEVGGEHGLVAHQGGARGSSLVPVGALPFTGAASHVGAGKGSAPNPGWSGEPGRITLTVRGVATVFNFTGAAQQFTVR